MTTVTKMFQVFLMKIMEYIFPQPISVMPSDLQNSYIKLQHQATLKKKRNFYSLGNKSTFPR